MRFQALQVAISFLKDEVPGSKIPDQPLEALLNADALHLIDVRKLMDRHGEEVAYWLANSSTTEDESMRVQLLDKFCGRRKSNQWPYKEYGCNVSSPNVAAFTEETISAATARTFFVTQNGYMGLAPRFAKKGDLICVLLGCSVPIIIRKVEANYVVVGDAYIYGMMQGEMMEEVEKGRLHVQDLIFQ